MRRKPNAFILLLLLLLGLYLGYGQYQTKQYSATLLPTYQAMSALQDNLEPGFPVTHNDDDGGSTPKSRYNSI